MESPKPSGHNDGGYRGETIRVDSLLESMVGISRSRGWESQVYLQEEGLKHYHFRRGRTSRANLRVYVSAGIHGDEPAGPLAIQELLVRDRWPELDVHLFPCLNPWGLRVNRRENADGIDLNRDYLHVRAAETRAHLRILENLPDFDLALCLHEDWEARGFYLYELNRSGRATSIEEVIRRVSRVCPIDVSDRIDGWVAERGVIRPDPDPKRRPEWPEAFYLAMNKTGWSCTLEAPSDFALQVRVGALVMAVEAFLDAL